MTWAEQHHDICNPGSLAAVVVLSCKIIICPTQVMALQMVCHRKLTTQPVNAILWTFCIQLRGTWKNFVQSLSLNKGKTAVCGSPMHLLFVMIPPILYYSILVWGDITSNQREMPMFFYSVQAQEYGCYSSGYRIVMYCVVKILYTLYSVNLNSSAFQCLFHWWWKSEDWRFWTVSWQKWHFWAWQR